MPSLLPLCMLLSGAASAGEPPVRDPAPLRAERALTQGVRRAHGFEGWRAPLAHDALQEAWCLALEHHPDVWTLSDAEVATRVVQVARRDGRTVQMALETRLYELGIQARNAVLRDNHLNRQTGGERARFTHVDAADRHHLARCGTRAAPTRSEES